MVQRLINRKFYEAIVHFDENEKAQDYYYQIMSTETGRIGKNDRPETVRDQILRVYSMLFCDNIGAVAGQIAQFEDVEATADCLYIGSFGFDPQHWYRMQHHFPVIDEDNYDRFAALVIADLSSGPLHEAALQGDDMLLVGEPNPLFMTPQQRKSQQMRVIRVGENGSDML